MILLGIFSKGNAQEGNSSTIDREPYAAGKFYSGSPERLRQDLRDLFQRARAPSQNNVRAIIVPHAGYPYSGEVAASGFNQIDPGSDFENIFVLASSHRLAFNGASIYSRGDYVTPLGKARVNTSLAKKLISDHQVFTFREDAHSQEHSLEVQIPFLQHHLQNDFQIVPIVIGARDQNDCRRIADALKPYFNSKNLFVISTDFSHYPSYDNAVKVDRATAEAIVTNSVKKLAQTLEENSQKSIPELATSLCGWSSVYTLMYLTEGNADLKYREIQYRNSGDAVFGDKDNVVGYHSIAVVEKDKADKAFLINREEKKKLLEIARITLEVYLASGKKPEISAENLPESLMQKTGAFVSLHKKEDLRGCIGRFTFKLPLYRLVQNMAIAAATEDRRFDPVVLSELPDIDIEISVLSPMIKINTADEIVPGKHGIYIRKGHATGTFLPQVATKTGWNPGQLLGHCARDKARIGWDGWKEADVFIYEAVVFNEKEIGD